MAQSDQHADKKKKQQGSPFSLFFAAFLAFLFGAPIGIVLFLVGVGIIIWRVQASAKSKEKLPPIPPKEKHFASEYRTRSNNSSMTQTPQPFQDTSWGRREHTTEDPSHEDFKPNASTEQNWPKPRKPEFESSAEDLVLQSSEIGNQSHGHHENNPVIPPKSNRATNVRQSKGSDLGLILNNTNGLRQAIVAMAVLGPCRAQDPHTGDLMQTGLPSRTNPDRDERATPSRPQSPQN